MARTARDFLGGGILPAPACDLLDRFTAELGVPLTLTDLNGTVVASTAGALAGSVEHAVLSALDQPGALAPHAEPLRVGDRTLAPIRLSGRVAGVLAAHGEGARLRETVPVLAVSMGLALDFAEAASTMGRDSISPGLLLYGLLRGSRLEAQRAAVLSSMLGWNLFVQRVAVVVTLPPDAARLDDADPTRMAESLLGTAAGATPFGQVDEAQWVVLVDHEPGQPWTRIRRLADELQRRLAPFGPATVGIGEPHLPINRIAALRRSYREALYAARLGPRLHAGPGVYELRMLGPAAFFAPSSPSRRNLAQMVLAPLRDQPAVLQTLRAYLTYDLSVAATAAYLGVHRHTVRNHLERVSDETGLDPRSLSDALQLKLALLVVSSDVGPEGAP